MWKQIADIRSAALLVSDDHDINIGGWPEDVMRLQFSKPELIGEACKPNWDHALDLPMWKYKVQLTFHAETEEIATRKAWKRLESIVSRLSFVASAPVEIEAYGSITTAVDPPVIGEEYTTISLCNEQGWAGRQPTVLSEEDIKFLPNLLLPKNPEDSGNERLNRSMRWLQHSHFAKSPVDEFVCLLLSFEGISHLIKQPVKQYWKCGSCDGEMTGCPKCGATTEWTGSGKSAMKDFVLNVINDQHKWTAKDWKVVWELRNTLFHGTHDLSFAQQQLAATFLPKLETAVVVAIKSLLGLPPEAPPRNIRQRNSFYAETLNIKWRHNGTPTRDAPGD